jgi:hypothetical protein
VSPLSVVDLDPSCWDYALVEQIAVHPEKRISGPAAISGINAGINPSELGVPSGGILHDCLRDVQVTTPQIAQFFCLDA